MAEIHKKIGGHVFWSTLYIKFCSILHQIKFVIRISDRRRKLVEVHKIAALENIAHSSFNKTASQPIAELGNSMLRPQRAPHFDDSLTPSPHTQYPLLPVYDSYYDHFPRMNRSHTIVTLPFKVYK